MDPSGHALEERGSSGGWKEKSFLYNVLICNINGDLGVGIGVGGSIDLGSIFSIEAISRADIWGIELKDGKIKMGHFGRSAASIGIFNFSVGVDSRTYESFDGTEIYDYQEVPSINVGIGIEIGIVLAAHFNIGVSLSGIYEDLVTYPERLR